MWSLVVYFGLLGLLQTSAQIIQSGQCNPDINSVQNFNIDNFMGVWHEIESYPSTFQAGTCNNARYSIDPSGAIDVINTQVIDQRLDTVRSNATVSEDANGTGKLVVTLPGGETGLAGQDLNCMWARYITRSCPSGAHDIDRLLVIEIPYWILHTDYVDYALGYSCININEDFRGIWSWKLSRSKELSTAANVAIDAVISSIDVLENSYYEPVDQSDSACFYLPDLEPGEPVVIEGQCQTDIPVVQNFDIEKYAGRWHLIETYPSDFQNGTCNDATYLPQGASVVLINTQVVDERLVSREASAVPITANNEGKFLVTFSGAEPVEYWILDTDYESYALVYFCVNLDSERQRVWSWKLSRTRNLSEIAVERINEVIDSVNVLNNRYYEAIDNSDEGCFYYPVPDGNPVIFRGQCDENVSVVTDFNVEKYMGIWYDIESYPQEFQNGTCSTATYRLTPDGVEVNNTQVINETLDFIYGRAVPDNDQGLAKLIVTFPIAGTELTIDIPYWILDTDYENYALVYACVNLGEESRRVWSWKLSRSKELSTAAKVAIDSAISSIDVLGNDYYEPVDQSFPACFYLPDLEPGEPFVIEGQCQTDIPVVQNFDIEKYAGRWHLIETYPSDFQNGTCNDATYLPQGASVVLINTQVVDERLVSREASAVPITDNNEGKFLVTFSGAEPVEYWILDTDYESYALVYFCVNLDSERQRVWTWKLSRTRNLSEIAVERINEVIDSVNVLNNRYYEAIDNSDEGCFYYPVPNGNPVIFRGQCDENVSVVTDFDVEKYMGIWYDIESYPQEFQNGTCSTATYRLTPDGVEVNTTQVINETLDFIYGRAVPDNDQGLAKLIVTFPIAGTELTIDIPYWILDTDYENYALVYACVNLGEDSRRVWSWKLSRSKELSTAAKVAIDSAISSIDVLGNDYYEPVDQSFPACFYLPDLEPGEPFVIEGQCQTDIPVVQNFDIEKYAGRWHLIETYPSDFQNGTCNDATYLPQGASVLLINTQVVDERLVSREASAVPITDNNEGKFLVTFSGAEPVEYWILDTDYESYALVYFCVNLDSERQRVWTWKLSRTRNLSEIAVERINEVIDSVNVLNNRYYEAIDNSDEGCFYYPIPDGNPVIFRGQCDENISGVTDFDVEKYLGRWFEIAKYPERDLIGECSRVHYSGGQGQAPVDVVNTIVYNQTLETRDGIAVLASTDGSGLLTVTFELDDGVVAVENYYVLATDYTDYALVYSCRDLDSDDSEVYSWKLSRQPTLSNAANNIINNVISNTRGLLEDYYQPTSQSVEDCFYVPEPNPDEAVLFRGECEDLQGMPGFDMSQYVGWWHEIERYPTGEDAGACISSQYSGAGNSYQVVDTSVFNLTGQLSSGSVVASPNGMLTRTMTNGQSQVIWVLATDYETYSLLYSCTPTEDGEYRRVWSAKHSKVRSLSEAAQAAMEPLIAANEVLHQQLYLAVDQGDAACFHYPPPAERVLLPGQCDDGIPDVPNFDPVHYTGTWYQLERYPHPGAVGTCVGARYAYDAETRVVSVLNWYMADGTLRTVEGTATVDGAKLIVTLPVENTNGTVTTELRVLHTDYVTYSVAYTCTNVNQFQRAVEAFKFSRTRDLPDSAVTSINNYMASREELHQEYFQAVTHENCLEPSAAWPVKSGSIIILVCAALQLYFSLSYF